MFEFPGGGVNDEIRRKVEMKERDRNTMILEGNGGEGMEFVMDMREYMGPRFTRSLAALSLARRFSDDARRAGEYEAVLEVYKLLERRCVLELESVVLDGERVVGEGFGDLEGLEGGLGGGGGGGPPGPAFLGTRGGGKTPEGPPPPPM